MLIITEFLIFLALAFLLSLFYRNRRFLFLSWKIPSLKFSIVKNLRRKIDNRTICRLLYDHLWQVQNVAKVWLGPCFFVIVASPEYAKVVMNKCLDKAWMVDFMQLEQSVLFGSGNVWQTHRKIMSPYFGVNTVKNLIPMFKESARLLIDNVEKMSGKGEFDVFNFMAALTLETVLKAMELEVDLQNQEPKNRDVAIENLEIMTRAITKRALIFWFHNESLYKQTRIYRREMMAREKWQSDLADKIMRKIRREPNEEEKPKNFIRALMDEKFGLSEKEIQDTIYSMNLAAQDTSAIVMSTTLLMLAMHQDIQQKVYDEISQTLDSSQTYDHASLLNLKYLEMVLNEVMRLFPVVPYAFRKTGDEITIEDVTIPANTSLFIPILHIHRNPLYWGKDANLFKPERFEVENFAKIHPYAFMPFTKGPRMCLGWRYAILLLKTVLSSFLMRYEVHTEKKFEEIELTLGCTLTIHGGYKIRISERK